jgi:hypothetical protein
MDTSTLRRWATPLTIGAFLLMSITGIPSANENSVS